MPIGTRRIDVVISVKVDNNGKNQAYVDNVSLTLAAAPASRRRRGRRPSTRQCAAGTLSPTVKPAKASTVTSVVFLVDGTRARNRQEGAVRGEAHHDRGCRPSSRVSARVTAAGKTTTLTSSIERC